MRIGLGIGIGMFAGGGVTFTGAVPECSPDVPAATFHLWVASDEPDLVIWRRADLGITKDGSDRVSLWEDQVNDDANKDAAQSTAGVKPLWNASDANLGGRPSLSFDRARVDHLDTGTLATEIPTGSTWFLVTYNTSYDTANNSWIAPLTTGQTAYINAAGPGQVGAYAGSVLAGGSTGAAPQAVVSAHIFSVPSGKVFGNARTALASGSTGSNTQPSYKIGQTVANSIPAGSIAEEIVLDVIATQATVERILRNLGAYYGVSIGA